VLERGGGVGGGGVWGELGGGCVTHGMRHDAFICVPLHTRVCDRPCGALDLVEVRAACYL